MSGLAAARAARVGQAWQDAMERSLQSIDDTLDDYDTWHGHSPDAARWAGEPDEGEWRPGDLDDAAMTGRSHVIVRPGETRVWWGDPATPTQAEIDNATELVPYLQAVDSAVVLMLRASGLEPAEWQRLAPAGRECWKCRRWHYGEGMRCDTCWPKQLPRPHSAAERTRSPQWRAGTRRAKRQARRRHG